MLTGGPATARPGAFRGCISGRRGALEGSPQAGWRLMVLDVSGSMSGQKLEVMKRGAAGSLDLFLDDDELALLVLQ